MALTAWYDKVLGEVALRQRADGGVNGKLGVWEGGVMNMNLAPRNMARFKQNKGCVQTGCYAATRSASAATNPGRRPVSAAVSASAVLLIRRSSSFCR
jgi:hypothetical protein